MKGKERKRNKMHLLVSGSSGQEAWDSCAEGECAGGPVVS